MQDRNERVNVYIGGELKGTALFRGTSSSASLTSLDFTDFFPIEGSIQVEFSEGDRWEFRRPHTTLSSGVVSTMQMELIEGRLINSQKDE